MKSILYVFLPCKKIYPVGITYLANFVHQHHSDVRQQILDLSLIPPHKRTSTLRSCVSSFRPDLVCFSLRDIQIFAPHEGDSSLEHAFNFYYSPNPFKRIIASFQGVHAMMAYYWGIRRNLSYPWLIHREFRGTRIAMGGGAFSVFSRQLIDRLPPGTVGVIGEGENFLLKMIEGREIEDERVIFKKGDNIFKGSQREPVRVDLLSLDLSYISSIFPQAPAYYQECIGVQTKRGCPYDCQFCEYPYIEGKRVYFRSPERVVDEITQFYTKWGTRWFWFADAQFITGSKAYPQVTEILERIIRSGMKIKWSGYIRTSLITADLARLMVRSGLGDLEVSITSGSQAVIDDLRMGFKLEELYEGCRYLAKAGYTGRILLNYSLNSPADTEETLLESVESYKRIAGILGEDRVFPILFFLGIQPNTGLEERLLEEGYLSRGYNPLSLNPSTVKKMLYNPAPLNKLIAKACLGAWGEKEKRRIHSSTPAYADDSLIRATRKDTGRQALLNLEAEIKKRSASSV